MNQKQMENWVARNCKFAGVFDFIPEELRNRMIAHPDQAPRLMAEIYRNRAGLGGSFSELSRADVAADLAKADSRIFPGQGPVLSRPDVIDEIFTQAQPQARPQAAPPAGNPYVPDEFEQFRARRLRQPMPGKANLPPQGGVPPITTRPGR